MNLNRSLPISAHYGTGIPSFLRQKVPASPTEERSTPFDRTGCFRGAPVPGSSSD